MEKNSILILSLIALSTIVTLMTKMVEYRLAVMKLKKETEQPTSTKTASVPIQNSSARQRWLMIFSIINLAAYASAMVFFLFAMFFGPRTPLTFREAAFLAALLGTAIVASRSYRRDA